MEKVKVTPEDLQFRFKSKEDLYDLLSLDRKYFYCLCFSPVPLAAL